MHTFEKLIHSDQQTIVDNQSEQSVKIQVSGVSGNFKSTTTDFVNSEENTHSIQLKVKQTLDDFGMPIVASKASSPFETKQSAKKVLNPNQKSLQGFLKDSQRDKVVRKAAMLYSAFKKHCAQNKIDVSLFTGVSK
jgi:hypothetical protein